MRIIAILICSWFLSNCSVQKHFVTDSIEISLQNKILKIPSNEGQSHNDTLVFHLKNTTEYNYYFALPSNSITYYDHVLKEDYNFISDPFMGIGLKFINKFDKALEVTNYSGYDPEAFEAIDDFYPIKHLYKVLSNDTIELRLINPFPQLAKFGFFQKVRNLENTSKVEVVFAPPKEQTLLYLQHNNIRISSNDKVLDLIKVFYLETILNENSK